MPFKNTSLGSHNDKTQHLSDDGRTGVCLDVSDQHSRTYKVCEMPAPDSGLIPLFDGSNIDIFLDKFTTYAQMARIPLKEWKNTAETYYAKHLSPDLTFFLEGNLDWSQFEDKMRSIYVSEGYRSMHLFFLDTKQLPLISRLRKCHELLTGKKNRYWKLYLANLKGLYSFLRPITSGWDHPVIIERLGEDLYNFLTQEAIPTCPINIESALETFAIITHSALLKAEADAEKAEPQKPKATNTHIPFREKKLAKMSEICTVCHSYEHTIKECPTLIFATRKTDHSVVSSINYNTSSVKRIENFNRVTDLCLDENLEKLTNQIFGPNTLLRLCDELALNPLFGELLLTLLRTNEGTNVPNFKTFSRLDIKDYMGIVSVREAGILQDWISHICNRQSNSQKLETKNNKLSTSDLLNNSNLLHSQSSTLFYIDAIVGTRYSAFIDTFSLVSMICEKVCQQNNIEIKPLSNLNIFVANGDRLDVVGIANVDLQIMGVDFCIKMLVVRDFLYDIFLGNNFVIESKMEVKLPLCSDYISLTLHSPDPKSSFSVTRNIQKPVFEDSDIVRLYATRIKPSGNMNSLLGPSPSTKTG